MRILLGFPFFIFFLSGCSGISALNESLANLNTDFGIAIGYSAPTLAGQPESSGCALPACKKLDAIEAERYRQARAGKITWTNLVEDFYNERSKLFPHNTDTPGVSELKYYQRLLAEQMDAGKITESQWAYLVEKKTQELAARDELVANSRPRTQNCTTTKLGTEYNTACR